MKSVLLLVTAVIIAAPGLRAKTNQDSASSAPPPALRAEPVQIPDEPLPAQPVPEGEIPVKARRTPTRALDFKGKIEKLDAEAGTFTVDGKAFVLSKHGKVYVDNVRKPLADLKVGNLVAVTYFEKTDGNQATQVIKGYPSKEKKKKKKK